MRYELPAILAEPDRGKLAGRALAGHLCEHGDEWDIARLMLGATNPWLEPEWLPDEFSLLPAGCAPPSSCRSTASATSTPVAAT